MLRVKRDTPLLSQTRYVGFVLRVHIGCGKRIVRTKLITSSFQQALLVNFALLVGTAWNEFNWGRFIHSLAAYVTIRFCVMVEFPVFKVTLLINSPGVEHFGGF